MYVVDNFQELNDINLQNKYLIWQANILSI